MVFIVLLVVIPLVMLLYTRRKREKMKAIGEKKHHLSKAHLIRYDKHQCKQSFICTIVFFALAVFSSVIVYFGDVIEFSDLLMIIVLLVYLCSGPALLYSVYQLLSGISYLKRLKKHGYEVPENKKDYDSLLELLPHQEQEVDEDTKEMCNKTSLALGIGSLITLLVLFGIDVWFVAEWYSYYKSEIIFVLSLISVIDVVLLVYCIIFLRQKDEKRYKDDVEIDENRKNRMPLVEGILTIFILLVLSGAVKHTAHSMTNYVFKARVSADIETVQNIRQSLVTTYVLTEAKETDALWEERKNELMQGVDITTWGVPEDEFQKEVANIIGISDFTQLKEDFRTSDGDAIVYVQIVEDVLRVELKNPIDKVQELDSSIRVEYTIQ